MRPEFELPEYEGLELTVDSVEVDDAEVDEELDRLRSRFGTLVTVDRPADDRRLRRRSTSSPRSTTPRSTPPAASRTSSARASCSRASTRRSTRSPRARPRPSRRSSLGGDHEGETAEITVTVTAVKERELPEADDDFAQIASEFDTHRRADARASRSRSAATSRSARARQARDQLVEKLLELVEVPVADSVIEDEVHRHLEGEGRLEDDEHRAEVTESSEKAVQDADRCSTRSPRPRSVQVSQDELTQYLVQGAAQYGMDPNEFVQVLSQNGQIPAMVGEVARNKALAIALGKAKVTDAARQPVDLSEFTAVPRTRPTPRRGRRTRPRRSRLHAAEADETIAAEEAERAKKPARKRAAKKADAEYGRSITSGAGRIRPAPLSSRRSIR